MFGQKDWQQLAILRRMARDLNMPVTLVGCPIVREAPTVWRFPRATRTLRRKKGPWPRIFTRGLQAKILYDAGERNTAALVRAVRGYWAAHVALGREDYLSFVHPESIALAPEILAAAEPCLVAAPCASGSRRLYR